MADSESGVHVSIEEGSVLTLTQNECSVHITEEQPAVILIEDATSATFLGLEETTLFLHEEKQPESAIEIVSDSVICLEVGIPGPTGTPGNDITIDLPADCLASDTVGKLVYITGDPIADRLQVSTVDIDDGARMPAVGILVSKDSPTQCFVRLSGVYDADAPIFTSGNIVYVSTSGDLSTNPPTRPSTGTRFIQRVGVALSPTKVAVNIQNIIQEILP